MVQECRKSSCPLSQCGLFLPSSGCWCPFASPQPPAKTLGTMSRCYPYPPPGYEKKAYVEPPLSPKKEKHKHKDKKKKRRRDSEANGDSRPRDKDKRSKKVHQTANVKDLLSLANGGLPEAKATTSAAVHEDTLQILQAKHPRENLLADDTLASIRKGLQPICMVDNQTPLMSFRAAGSCNGAAVKDVVVPSSKAVSEIEDELSRRRRVEFMPHVEKVWSAVDDQEWLFLCDNQLQLGSKEKFSASETPQVWAEAILLPSVGIYALPYVVPD